MTYHVATRPVDLLMSPDDVASNDWYEVAEVAANDWYEVAGGRSVGQWECVIGWYEVAGYAVIRMQSRSSLRLLETKATIESRASKSSVNSNIRVTNEGSSTNEDGQSSLEPTFKQALGYLKMEMEMEFPTPPMTQAAIRKLVANSIAATLEEVANIA
ncbi:hypothetical protein Tco_0883233 [Tanacetum coccineum]